MNLRFLIILIFTFEICTYNPIDSTTANTTTTYQLIPNVNKNAIDTTDPTPRVSFDTFPAQIIQPRQNVSSQTPSRVSNLHTLRQQQVNKHNEQQQQSFFCDIKPKTSFWVVLCAILPIYAMATFTSKSPSIILTYDEIDIKDNKDIHVLMTLTSPSCPAAESIPSDVKNRIEMIKEIND